MKCQRCWHPSAALTFNVSSRINPPFWSHRFRVIVYNHSTGAAHCFTGLCVEDQSSTITKRTYLIGNIQWWRRFLLHKFQLELRYGELNIDNMFTKYWIVHNLVTLTT